MVLGLIFLVALVFWPRQAFAGTWLCLIGHLAIAYDHIDPGQIRVCIGADVGITEEQCRVCQGAYGVLGNTPDPAAIGVESGLVKYNLVAREHVGDLRVETRNDESRSLGSVHRPDAG